MKWLPDLNNYEWWRNHRKIITYGGFLLLLGMYINPVIQEAEYKNKCIEFARKELIYSSSKGTQALSKSELALLTAYQACNHRGT